MGLKIACGNCEHFRKLRKTEDSFGICVFKIDIENLRQHVPFFVRLSQSYGSISPHDGSECTVFKEKRDGNV
jgi:hypothetical protein